ncbi:hypothetical protein D1007_21440 [Hordeum vulgare]|nr:hypothetical protein D1007_21440 [Hordeum vulgare]
MFAPRKVEDEMALGRQRTVRTVLVTGGAGYIGSHAVLQLLAAGFRAVVVDSLENSSELAARRGTRAEPLLPQAPKDKIFEKVINPYLTGVLQHPQSIEMREGMLHILDVEGPKKTGSMETRLEAMDQQVLKCQGMVERGLNANHMMITEFTNKHMIDANDIGKHFSRLYDRIDQLQAQIYDLQNKNRMQGLRIQLWRGMRPSPKRAAARAEPREDGAS